MANTRIKDLTNTAVTVPSDAYVAIDGSANGTAKISRDDLRQDTADAIAAAPSTYNLAPLTSGSVDVDKGGTGSTTLAGAKLNLEVPNVGTAANEVPLNGMLNSGAWLDFDAFYDEGTWTPAVEFGGASSGTYSIASGFYTRVGNVVHVSCQLNSATKGLATGSATIVGLPFSPPVTGGIYPFVGNVTLFNAANLTSAATALVVPNSTTVNLYDWGANGTTPLDDTNFGSGTIVRFSATYQIA